jgi:hypothetical protein
MTFIVNLSAVHTLLPISTNLAAFADICDRYSEGCCSCWPGLFSWTNYGWVSYHYQTRYAELIEPYKLGQIDSDQFLANLSEIFDFLDDDDLDQGVLLRARKNVHYSTNNKHALLEEAWNASIALDETTNYRLPDLADQNEPVYLVSNTNELNVIAIIALLKAKNPDIQFEETIDLSVTEDRKPIKIAPNIYLCLSYRYQLFKTAEQNTTSNPNSTMSLLRHLVENELATDKADIKVISQYDGDLAEAKNIGIPQANLYRSEDYFKPAISEILIV